MKKLKPYYSTIVVLLVLLVLYFFRRDIAVKSVNLSLKSAVSMLGILPPILLIVNFFDVWVPKDTIIRHMGPDAGLKGFAWAFFLGTLAAGPLYVAFPVASLLAKKGARLAYIIFMLGIWTSTKLPIFMYELNFFGGTFTLIHATTGIIVYYIFSLLMEKVLLRNRIEEIYKTLAL